MEAGLEGEEPKGAPAGGGSSLEVQVWMKVQVWMEVQVMRCCGLEVTVARPVGLQDLGLCRMHCVTNVPLGNEALVHFLFD